MKVSRLIFGILIAMLGYNYSMDGFHDMTQRGVRLEVRDYLATPFKYSVDPFREINPDLKIGREQFLRAGIRPVEVTITNQNKKSISVSAKTVSHLYPPTLISSQRAARKFYSSNILPAMLIPGGLWLSIGLLYFFKRYEQILKWIGEQTGLERYKNATGTGATKGERIKGSFSLALNSTIAWTLLSTVIGSTWIWKNVSKNKMIDQAFAQESLSCEPLVITPGETKNFLLYLNLNDPHAAKTDDALKLHIVDENGQSVVTTFDVELGKIMPTFGNTLRKDLKTSMLHYLGLCGTNCIACRVKKGRFPL